MYRLSVPIMSSTVHEHNRDIYVRQCRNAGATRVFLCAPSPTEEIPPSLGENVAFFQSQGFTVGVWTDTIGHGFVLSHAKSDENAPKFQEMVDITGKRRPYANCPLDPVFRNRTASHIADLARISPDIIMLDDDFRMSQHGPNLCCACDAHLKRISEILGEAVTLDGIRPYILSGKKNKYRSAWLKAQNEGLLLLAREIRAAVDLVNPNITVCFCTAYAPWNADNLDVAEASRILAGKNKPILRLTGAPYWATKKRNYPLISVFEIARMLASFAKDWDFDLMCEGDVYPRPRYTCPAAYLELYDAVMRADGTYNGILKYMFDYIAGPEMETGFLKMHDESKPFFDALPHFFRSGANAGVRVVAYPHTMEGADLDLAPISVHTPRPTDGAIFSMCGIPTVYGKAGVCNSVFGENARQYSLSSLKEGTVLDAVSAVILTERGVDVGLDKQDGFSQKLISYLSTSDREYNSFIADGSVRMLSATLKENASPVLFTPKENGTETVAYTYENASGDRFLVFLFEGDSMSDEQTRICDSGIMKNYAMQRILTEHLPWVARAPLPAYIVNNPNAYILCEKDEDSLSVLVENCFADPLTHPVIVLGDAYDKIECFGCEATLNGNTVTIVSKQYGFTSALFRVTKAKN